VRKMKIEIEFLLSQIKRSKMFPIDFTLYRARLSFGVSIEFLGKVFQLTIS